MAFVVGLGLAGSAACIQAGIDAERGNPTSARVVDAATRAPIAGALVTYQWTETASNLAGTSTQCIHVEVRRSGANGEVEVPAHQGYLPSGTSIYVRRFWRQALGYVGESEMGMSRFEGSAAERFQLLRRLFTTCLGDREGWRKLREVDSALLAEMREVASSREEQESVDRLESLYRQYRWRP